MDTSGEFHDAPAWYRQAMDVPYQDHTVDVAGAHIHYMAWGEPGRPGLVFVHGGAAHAHWWTPEIHADQPRDGGLGSPHRSDASSIPKGPDRPHR